MGYKKDTLKGISWIGSLRLLTKAIGFLEAIILAHILVPEQFGAYGVALLGLGLLEVLTETGVNIVLIQEKNIDDYVSSAWIVSIIRGCVISFLLFFASPLIAGFFHSPDSLSLLYLICIVPLLRGFINPSVVKFQKDLLFGKDFGYRTLILIVDTMVSITLTFILHSPVGIIVGLLAGVAIELILSFVIVSPRPQFKFRKGYIGTIFHRGKWITATTIFDYVFFNADNIVVGRMLGATSLGIYQLAYSLSVMPLTELSRVFVHVSFPIFTKLAADRSRLRVGFFKSTLLLFCLSIPYVAVLLLFPQLFVMLLGEKWATVASVLPVLAVLGLLRGLSGSSASLFLSERKQNYTTITSLVTIIGLMMTIIPLVQVYGIVGAATAALLGSLIAIPLYMLYIYRIFKSSL